VDLSFSRQERNIVARPPSDTSGGDTPGSLAEKSDVTIVTAIGLQPTNSRKDFLDYVSPVGPSDFPATAVRTRVSGSDEPQRKIASPSAERMSEGFATLSRF